jgi:hypothetical protein
MNTGIPIFGPEIDQNVGKLLQTVARPIFPTAREGDFNPILGFYFPLFSIVFPWEISIKVESGGFSRKKNCGVLWRLYIQIFICIGRSAFPQEYQKSRYNAVFSAHHSFAAPIPPGLPLGPDDAAVGFSHPGANVCLPPSPPSWFKAISMAKS